MKKRIIILICISLIFFISLIALQYELSRIWNQKNIIALQKNVVIIKERMESSIAMRFDSLTALNALFSIAPHTSPEDFGLFSEKLMSANGPIRALQYANEQTLVIYVYPAKGNEITIKNPMRLLTDPKRGPYVKKAIEQRIPTLQGPFELRQGGQGIIIRSPIFYDDKFLGLVIGVFNAEDLIDESIRAIDLQKYKIEIYDDDNMIFFGDNIVHDEENSFHITAELNVCDVQWELHVGLISSQKNLPFLHYLVIWGIGGVFYILVVLLILFLIEQTNRLQQAVEGRTKELTLINQDLEEEIKERKLAEENISFLLNEKEVILREVHHRIKNNMNTIHILLSSRLEQINDDEAYNVFINAINHLKTMETLYIQLYQRVNDYSNIKTREYFVQVIDKVVSTFKNHENITVKKDLDDFEIKSQIVFYLGIIFNELLTNSLKHAFGDHKSGLIEISLKKSSDKVQLLYRDNGKGFNKDLKLSQAKGFGLNLLKIMTQQLQGHITIKSDPGAFVLIEFSLSSI